MTNGTFFRLGLLGLTVVGSAAFAASTISGMVRLDALYPNATLVDNGTTTSIQNDAKNYFDVTRARVNISGDLVDDFNYFVRLESTQGFNISSSNPRSITIAQCYASWSGMDNSQLNIGLTPGPSFSADEYYYKPYIVHDESTETAFGVIKEINGNNAGIDLNGQASMVGYSIGFWKASDVSAYLVDTDTSNPYGLISYSGTDENSEAGNRLRFGYGLRLGITPVESDNASVGIGIGFSNTPITKLVGMKGSTLSTSDVVSTADYYTSFDQQIDLTIDACAVFGDMQMNIGYSEQKIKTDLNGGTALNADDADLQYTNTLFDVNGKRIGYYAEVGYILSGYGYKYDSKRAIINGVNFERGQGVMEVVFRAGFDTKENAIAWMDDVGVTDGSIVYDNTNETTGGHTINKYKKETKGLNLNMNYYVNKNAVLKSQYQMTTYSIDNFVGSFSKGSEIDSDDNLSTNYKKTKNLSFRAEYSF